MGIHWQELIVILLIVLVLFGPKRLPEIGSSLGRGIHGFRNSLQGLEADGSPRVDHGSSTVTHAAATPAVQTAPVAPAPVEVVSAPEVAAPDSASH